MSAFRVKYLIGISIYTIFCAVLVLMQSVGLLSLKLGNASVVLALPLVLYTGYYFGAFGGIAVGFLVGAATDVYSSTLMFNTCFFAVLGFAAGLIMYYFFNRNFTAAVVSNVLASVAYFFLKWLIVYAFWDPAAGFVLTNISLPSALITAVVGIVLYFAVNPILKRIPVRPSKR